MLTISYVLLSTIWEINDVKSQTEKTWVLLLEKYLSTCIPYQGYTEQGEDDGLCC